MDKLTGEEDWNTPPRCSECGENHWTNHPCRDSYKQRLIALCDCPEIQAKAVWEVGEMTDKGMITDIYEDRGDSFRWAEISVNETEGLQSKISDLIWLPSRYGTVGGWLKYRDYDVLKRGILYIIPQYNRKSFEAYTLLEAKIMLYMWVEHKKKWKEGKWKRKSYTGG